MHRLGLVLDLLLLLLTAAATALGRGPIVHLVLLIVVVGLVSRLFALFQSLTLDQYLVLQLVRRGQVSGFELPPRILQFILQDLHEYLRE